MSKELQALEHFVRTSVWNEDEFHEIWDNGNSDLEIVKEALYRLETIDNANSGEALKKLKTLGLICVYRDTWTPFEIHFKEEFDIIKQTLLKAQEMEKVLEIIKKKCSSGNSNLWLVTCLPNYEHYKSFVKNKDHELVRNEHNELTKEEFELLKRWVDVSSK